MLPDEGLHGRRKILTDATAITAENVAEVVGKANAIHRINRQEIDYLLGVYKGRQDIRNREKTVRPEIRNVVVVNRANEIVTFDIIISESAGTFEKLPQNKGKRVLPFSKVRERKPRGKNLVRQMCAKNRRGTRWQALRKYRGQRGPPTRSP